MNHVIDTEKTLPRAYSWGTLGFLLFVRLRRGIECGVAVGGVIVIEADFGVRTLYHCVEPQG